jgi:4-hydroxy-tetrahydrodipicolinate synthase
VPAFDPRTHLRGIVASLHTPFTDDHAVDTESLARLVRHCADSGCSGVLASAVAGEVAALGPAERQLLLATVAEAASGRLAVVAGVSAPDLATSRALAREARAAGAQMVLWQPPAGLAEPALEAGLQALADEGPGQVMLQDLDWQGPGLAPDTIARLVLKVPGLTAVKIETAPAGPKYSAVREATGGSVHLSGGWAAMQMLDGLARGLDAFIPSGVLPVYVRIFDLWSRGRQDQARTLFERALPILAFSNQHIEISIPFWKQLRRRQGIFTTALCRPPIRPLDRVQQAEADRLAVRALALEAERDGPPATGAASG